MGEGAATLVSARKTTVTIAEGRCFAAARATATFKNVVAAALLPWGHDTTAGEVVVAAPACVHHDIFLDDVTCAPAVLTVVADLANLCLVVSWWLRRWNIFILVVRLFP